MGVWECVCVCVCVSDESEFLGGLFLMCAAVLDMLYYLGRGISVSVRGRWNVGGHRGQIKL